MVTDDCNRQFVLLSYPASLPLSLLVLRIFSDEARRRFRRSDRCKTAGVSLKHDVGGFVFEVSMVKDVLRRIMIDRGRFKEF